MKKITNEQKTAIKICKYIQNGTRILYRSLDKLQGCGDYSNWEYMRVLGNIEANHAIENYLKARFRISSEIMEEDGFSKVEIDKAWI